MASTNDERRGPTGVDLFKILDTDNANLASSRKVLDEDSSGLREGVNVAYLALEECVHEVEGMRFSVGPKWVALHFIRTTAYSWVAALRCIFMGHRSEATTNVRVMCEQIGCVVHVVRNGASMTTEKLLDDLDTTKKVGAALARLPQTPQLQWLKKRKDGCSEHGAHGGIAQIVGRVRNAQQTRDEDNTVNLRCEVTYQDVPDSRHGGPLIAWLVNVAARVIDLFESDVAQPHNHALSPSWRFARDRLRDSCKTLAGRYPTALLAEPPEPDEQSSPSPDAAISTP